MGGENCYKDTGLGNLNGESGSICPAREPVELPCSDFVLADIGMSNR